MMNRKVMKAELAEIRNKGLATMIGTSLIIILAVYFGAKDKEDVILGITGLSCLMYLEHLVVSAMKLVVKSKHEIKLENLELKKQLEELLAEKRKEEREDEKLQAANKQG